MSNMKDMNDIIKLLEPKHLEDYTPVKHSVCRECLDCCSDQVPFKMQEIKRYKKQHKKLFRGTYLVPHNFEFYIQKKTRNKDSKCIFLKGTECLIYEDRPDICRHFGSNPISMCGLEGYDQCPPKETRNQLSTVARRKSFAIMEEIYNKKMGE